MIPKNVKPEDQKTYFDDKLIKTIGKAYKWKMETEEGKFELFADIARKEKVGTTYVSKVFNPNFISPRIIKKILSIKCHLAKNFEIAGYNCKADS